MMTLPMRKLKKITTYIAVLFIVVIIALPFAIKYGLIYALQKQGAQHVVIDSVSLNLFIGKLEINGLQFVGKNDQGLPTGR